MNRKLYTLLALLVLTSMILAACSGAATQAPAATQPPIATEAPTGTEAPETEAPATCAPAVADFNPVTADATGKSMTIAFEQEPDNLASNFSSMSFAEWIYQMIGGGLGKWDDQNAFIPDLATEIPSAENGGVSADGLTLT